MSPYESRGRTLEELGHSSDNFESPIKSANKPRNIIDDRKRFALGECFIGGRYLRIVSFFRARLPACFDQDEPRGRAAGLEGADDRSLLEIYIRNASLIGQTDISVAAQGQYVGQDRLVGMLMKVLGKWWADPDRPHELAGTPVPNVEVARSGQYQEQLPVVGHIMANQVFDRHRLQRVGFAR